jgi:hypothetical protein
MLKILLQNRLNCQKVMTIELTTWNVIKTQNVINFLKVVYFLNKTLTSTMNEKEPMNKPTTNKKITLNIGYKKCWLFDINENVGVTVKGKCNIFITKPVELPNRYYNSVANLKCSKNSKGNTCFTCFLFLK